MPRKPSVLIPFERIERAILIVRGEKVMFDADLASLYGVKTSALVQAVKRNLSRFPTDFMFQLSQKELQDWRSQIMISNPAAKMALRRRPYAFTEQGIAMLSSVLHSDVAISVNIQIIRTFVRLRQFLSDHAELARRLDALEKKYDKQFASVFEAIRQLMTPPTKEQREMGYHTLIEKVK